MAKSRNKAVLQCMFVQIQSFMLLTLAFDYEMVMNFCYQKIPTQITRPFKNTPFQEYGSGR